MKPTKDVVALVVDNGMYAPMAERLARDFKHVYYHCPSSGAFPTINPALIGYGLDNVEPVESIFGPHFDSIDVFVFLDCYFGPLQVYLESVGKKVWGARMGEELELERDATKKVMRKAGLPVNDYEVIVGLDKLRERLKKPGVVHVKISRWRGSFESFCSTSYKDVEPKLSEIEHEMGPWAQKQEFIVESDLPDRIEIGTDAYTIDGKFPEKLLVGIEVKDRSYVSIFKPWIHIPEPIRRWNEVMAPYLRKYGYRGFLSTEVRIGKDHEPFMIDACCRPGSPPNELYQELYLNIADIVWHGANGELVNPKPAAKFGVEVIMVSSWGGDMHWQPVDYPDKWKKNVKLHNCMRIGGRDYVIPQTYGLDEVGAVVGWGDTIKAAVEMVKKVGADVGGYGIKVPVDALDDAQKEIEKTDEIGLRVF